MPGTGLFGSTILDVAIGLFFVYLLLSLICSSINEIFASVFKWRAQNLEAGIRNLICDDDLFGKVMTHPLVRAMGNTRTETTVVQGAAGQPLAGMPSYIPSRIFAAALLDRMMPAGSDRLSVAGIRQQALAMLDTSDPRKKQIGGAVSALIDETSDPQRVAFRLDEIKRMVATLPAAPGSDQEQRLKELTAIISPARTVEEIEQAVSAVLPAGNTRAYVLKSLERMRCQITDIECEAGALHRNVARWYDDTMDRVSGAYKRKVQIWLLAIATVVSICLGADSLRIVNNLSINPVLRAAIAEAAARQTGPAGSLVAGGAGQGPATQAAAGAESPPAAPAGTEAPSIADLVQELRLFSALFGYGDMPVTSISDWLLWFIWRALGTALTVFAISLGAPFWFDVLNKVANVRGVGKRPEPTTEPTAPLTPVAPTAA